MDYNRFEPGDKAVCRPPNDINPPVESGSKVTIIDITEQEEDIIYTGPEATFEVWYEVQFEDEEETKLMTGTWLDRVED